MLGTEQYSFSVESGMLYPAITLFQVIMGNTLPDRITPIDLAPTCYIVAGLAPTLIMVRAQQGKTVEETIHAEQTLTGVRFASAPAPSESGETTTMAETGSGFTTSTLRSGQGERV
ncbi:hypothetical protein VNI00_008484 [Paramarasmius palmivorus]|uniref:Uncharacterized protein n=1 Tax=Paramarasmius palmivorus TaxID=297713 RepID=A0AAW0CWW9_9AGAR